MSIFKFVFGAPKPNPQPFAEPEALAEPEPLAEPEALAEPHWTYFGYRGHNHGHHFSRYGHLKNLYPFAKSKKRF